MAKTKKAVKKSPAATRTTRRPSPATSLPEPVAETVIQEQEPTPPVDTVLETAPLAATAETIEEVPVVVPEPERQPVPEPEPEPEPQPEPEPEERYKPGKRNPMTGMFTPEEIEYIEKHVTARKEAGRTENNQHFIRQCVNFCVNFRPGHQFGRANIPYFDFE